jgi:hypothetical protein
MACVEGLSVLDCQWVTSPILAMEMACSIQEVEIIFAEPEHDVRQELHDQYV